jgi:hypothetical protein
VFLSNEEIRKLAQLSSQDDGSLDASIVSNAGANLASEVNYLRLSRALGLHKNSLNLIQSNNL